MRDADARVRSTHERAAAVVSAARRAGLTIATAESLTGGRVCAALVAVPGASDVVRGAVVAYLPEIKVEVLGVEEATLASAGVVSEPTARQMAHGARAVMRADVAVATTGAAGPDPHDGAEPGTVCLGVADATGERSRTVLIAGARSEVVKGSVDAALDMLAELLDGSADR